MSQEEIIDVLRKKKEPLTSKELSLYIDVRIENIRRQLKKLVDHKEVLARKISKKEKTEKGYDKIKCMTNRTQVFFLPEE